MKAALCLILLVVAADAPVAQAPANGEISGRITDRKNGVPTLISTRPTCDGEVLQTYSVNVVHTEWLVGRDVERTSPEILMSRTLLAPGGEYLVVVLKAGRVVGGPVLPITDGRVSAPDDKPLGGMPVDEAIATLVEWARSPAPSR